MTQFLVLSPFPEIPAALLIQTINLIYIRNIANRCLRNYSSIMQLRKRILKNIKGELSMSIRDYFENLRHEREKQKKKESAQKVISGLAIGAAIGGAIGILFAPKAGKETRQEISGKVKETTAATKEKVKETVQEVKDKVDELKDKRIAIVDKTADTAGER